MNCFGALVRSFDFLGDDFSSDEMEVAKKSVPRMRDKCLGLYDRGACVSRIEGTGTNWMQ
jgi:hypothetical protein